jgi:two-component system, chemotaxis family, CheB/CheR fusion protein
MMRVLLEDNGYTTAIFATSEAFLAQYQAGAGGCLLIDAYLPGMNGFALLQRLNDANDPLPAIMITGNSDVPMAVQAMKAGAVDFIEKPVSPGDLLASIERALEQSRDADKVAQWRTEAQTHVAGLTARQKQIMELVLAGHPSKNIAADLGISQRTVENHRNAIMTRTGCKSLPALARLALAAAPQTERARTSSA